MVYDNQFPDLGLQATKKTVKWLAAFSLHYPRLREHASRMYLNTLVLTFLAIYYFQYNNMIQQYVW